MYNIKRTDKEIDDLLNTVMEQQVNGTKFRGMNYEDGVQAGIEWLLGVEDNNPMED